jgi:hypothetical protein
VPIGEVRRLYGVWRFVEILADVEVRGVEIRLTLGTLVAGPAEIFDDGVRGVLDTVDLFPPVEPDVADPDLVRARSYGEAEGIAEPVGYDAAGVRSRAASPVAGSTRKIAPLRATQSPRVRRSWLRSAPPPAAGGVCVPPTPVGGSPHGFLGVGLSCRLPPPWP